MGTTDTEGVFLFKTGSERQLKLHYANICPLRVASPDGGTESVDLRKIKRIDFMEPARKDALGKAMFDEWRFSPWTGEKLPEK